MRHQHLFDFEKQRRREGEGLDNTADVRLQDP